MAQIMIGADVKQLQQAADAFGRKAARLRQLVDDLGRFATNSQLWSGPDADSFRSSWPKVAAVVTSSAEQLAVVQKTLTANASQQSGASAK